MHTLKSKLKQTARSAGLWSGGLLLVATGTGFLTVAAWIFLVSLADALTAAGVIGAAYLGLGLVFIGFARSGAQEPEAAPHPAPRSQSEYPPLMSAFIYGVDAGSNWSKR